MDFVGRLGCFVFGWFGDVVVCGLDIEVCFFVKCCWFLLGSFIWSFGL